MFIEFFLMLNSLGMSNFWALDMDMRHYIQYISLDCLFALTQILEMTRQKKIQKYMTSCEITCASGSYVIVVRYTFVKYVLKYTVGDSLFHMELFHNHHWSHNDGRSSRCYICFLQM